ncbi:MAG: NAD(+) diphosphatase [Victivallaceae bacterium]|nr:NAD(+) diphosphatase [Victivallaceae bacterium]
MFEFVALPEEPIRTSSWQIAILFVGDALVVVPHGDSKMMLPRREMLGDFPALEFRQIGKLHDQFVAAAILPETTDFSAPEGLNVVNLRTALYALDAPERIAVGRARNLYSMLKERQFCPRCGGKLFRSAQPGALLCADCHYELFSRINPAVITLIHRDDRILLARNAHFATPTYALVAGFIEPGEKAEEAVAREIAEEVGITVDNIRYFDSQFWPFPGSLMLGFTAEYQAGTVHPDGEEIVDARWFAPDELPLIPKPGSIARRLIDNWLAQNQKSIAN